MGNIKHPWGPMQTQVVEPAAGVAAATIDGPCILQVGAAALDAAFTLNLTAGDSLQAGDEVMINWLSDTTARTMTPGTLFKGSTTATATASKTTTLLAKYDGAAFHLIGKQVQ